MRTLLTIILFLAGSTCFAQLDFRAGLTAGATTSQVSGDGLAGFHKVGPFAGAFVRTPLREKLAWQMEIVYTQKGSRKIPKAEEGNVFYTLKLNYVEVPILMQYELDKFTYEFGPSIGALVSYQEFTHIGDIFPARDFNRAEFSFNLGIGFHVKENLLLSWRFNNSIWRIRKHVGDNTFRLNLGQYSTALNFLVHYRL